MEKDVGLTLAANVKHFRESQGLTPYALAARAGITYRALRLLEARKTKNPTVQVLLKVSKALGVSLNHLLELPPSRRLSAQALRSPMVPPRVLSLLRQPRTRLLLRLLKESKVEQLQELIDYLLKLASPKVSRR